MTIKTIICEVTKTSKQFALDGRVMQLPVDFEGNYVKVVYRKFSGKILTMYYKGSSVKWEDIGEIYATNEYIP